MLQRKQTIYLILALATIVACLCLPIGSFEPKGMGLSNVMTNLWIVRADGVTAFDPWVLFAILIVCCPTVLFTIFDYRNRRRQARFCIFVMLLLIGWCVLYAAFSQLLFKDMIFHVGFASAFPLVSLILLWLARRAVLADEALVRAADRIR